MSWYSLFKSASQKEDAYLTGVLKQTDDGFVYVNISNDVMNGFYRLLDEEDIIQPPYREEKHNSVGAHISVIYADELGGWPLRDVGRKIKFKVKGVFSVVPDGWKGVDKVWAIEVESKDLEEIRRKHGLSPKIKGEEYHITFGLKKSK